MSFPGRVIRRSWSEGSDNVWRKGTNQPMEQDWRQKHDLRPARYLLRVCNKTSFR